VIRPPIERRVTPWKPLWFEDAHFVAVRIWQEFDGVRWWQMHEWQRPDGTTDASQGWIVGVRGWSPQARPTAEPAPGDPPPDLTRDEIAYLIDRLGGVNDPVGASALAKLRAKIA